MVKSIRRMQLQSVSAFQRPIALALLLAGMAIPASAQTTIYSDSFSRSGALLGSAPNTRPGSETWGGSAALSTDGVAAYSTYASPWNHIGWLPLSITNGMTYSASVTVNMAASGLYSGAEGTCWAALGFGGFATSGDMVGSGASWLLVRNNGGAEFWALRDATQATGAKAAGTYPSSSILRLDYTRAADGTAVASYFINGTLVTTYNYATAPTVNSIGIQAYYQPTGTTFDNFSVTVSAVPEPSTYAALAGVLALGCAVWLRRRAHAPTSHRLR